MPEKSFGGHYFRRAEMYDTKANAQKAAKRLRENYGYLVRVAKSGEPKPMLQWATWVRKTSW